MTVRLDFDFDPAIWIELPAIWCEETWVDHRAWARDLAECCWGDFDVEPGEYEVDNLALTLAMFAERLQPDQVPDQHFFLHLPDPRMMVLHVCVNLWEAEGEREAALRDLTNADDPSAVEPPSSTPSAPSTSVRVCAPCATVRSNPIRTTLLTREHCSRR